MSKGYSLSQKRRLITKYKKHRDKGDSHTAACEKVGVSRPAMEKWLKDFGSRPMKPNDGIATTEQAHKAWKDFASHPRNAKLQSRKKHSDMSVVVDLDTSKLKKEVEELSRSIERKVLRKQLLLAIAPSLVSHQRLRWLPRLFSRTDYTPFKSAIRYVDELVEEFFRTAK